GCDNMTAIVMLTLELSIVIFSALYDTRRIECQCLFSQLLFLFLSCIFFYFVVFFFYFFFFFFQAEDGIRDRNVTGVQTCALPICVAARIRVQVVRLVLHPARLPRAAVPRRAGALRAPDHEERRDPRVLPGGPARARRPARTREAGTARLHLSHPARPRVHPRHLVCARRDELRPGARGSRADPRAGGRAGPARAAVAGLDGGHLRLAQPRTPPHRATQALRPGGDQLRHAALAATLAAGDPRCARATQSAAARRAAAAGAGADGPYRRDHPGDTGPPRRGGLALLRPDGDPESGVAGADGPAARPAA